MTSQKAIEKIALGENLTCEFKRCGGNIENDILETVCAFLNRWGGDIFLGVEDDGTILGVPENAAKDLTRNFNNNIDGDVFRVTIPLDDAIPAAGENVPATTQVTDVPVNERQIQIL